jgi:hypothetical protein
MSGRSCFTSLARLPDRSTRVGQPRRRRATALSALRPIPFPRDCSLLGMEKPTISQARDRAEVL